MFSGISVVLLRVLFHEGSDEWHAEPQTDEEERFQLLDFTFLRLQEGFVSFVVVPCEFVHLNFSLAMTPLIGSLVGVEVGLRTPLTISNAWSAL